MLGVQGNLSNIYALCGQGVEALRLRQDVYSRFSKLCGEEHKFTLIAANNVVNSLIALQRFEEARSLVRKIMPVVQRVLGENDETTLRMRWYHARALDLKGATVNDLRESMTSFEGTLRMARRVLGGAHPIVALIEVDLRATRAALRARESS